MNLEVSCLAKLASIVAVIVVVLTLTVKFRIKNGLGPVWSISLPTYAEVEVDLELTKNCAV